MTVYRQICATAFSIALGSAASALPISPSERAKVFASCSGTFSALAAHQRSMSGNPPLNIEALRDSYEALLDAILPYAIDYGMPEEQAETWRFQAWIDQSTLLNDVAFSIDRKRAERAQKAAHARVETCSDLMLSPRSGSREADRFRKIRHEFGINSP